MVNPVLVLLLLDMVYIGGILQTMPHIAGP